MNAKTDADLTNKYLYNRSEYLVYKKYLPDFQNRIIKDDSGKSFYYVIWIVEGDSNNFVFCVNNQYNSRFNIKLFCTINSANYFFDNYANFLKSGAIVKEMHLFDNQGINVKSISFQTDCQTTLLHCLFNGISPC